MSLKRLTDKELATLEQSLVEGKAPGVQYSMADVRSEIQRRRPHDFDPRELASTILQQAHASPNGWTTYGAVWAAMTNNSPWVGNATQQRMASELGNVLAYCHQNNLPMLTTLVVQQGGELSERAINNICNECIRLGIDVGPDRRAFVEAEAKASRQIAAAQLPAS